LLLLLLLLLLLASLCEALSEEIGGNSIFKLFILYEALDIGKLLNEGIETSLRLEGKIISFPEGQTLSLEDQSLIYVCEA
jgi:hypothetical protein